MDTIIIATIAALGLFAGWIRCVEDRPKAGEQATGGFLARIRPIGYVLFLLIVGLTVWKAVSDARETAETVFSLKNQLELLTNLTATATEHVVNQKQMLLDSETTLLSISNIISDQTQLHIDQSKSIRNLRSLVQLQADFAHIDYLKEHSEQLFPLPSKFIDIIGDSKAHQNAIGKPSLIKELSIQIFDYRKKLSDSSDNFSLAVLEAGMTFADNTNNLPFDAFSILYNTTNTLSQVFDCLSGLETNQKADSPSELTKALNKADFQVGNLRAKFLSDCIEELDGFKLLLAGNCLVSINDDSDEFRGKFRRSLIELYESEKNWRQ